VSSRKGGSQGKKLFGVWGRWEPDRKAGAVVKTRVGGQGGEEAVGEQSYCMHYVSVTSVQLNRVCRRMQLSHCRRSLTELRHQRTSPEQQYVLSRPGHATKGNLRSEGRYIHFTHIF